MLIGPFCLGRLGITGVGFATYEDVAALGAISDVAMGFIAFAIGNEFRLEDLRKTGPVRPSSSASCRRSSPPRWWISPCSASISAPRHPLSRRPPSRSARSPRRRPHRHADGRCASTRPRARLTSLLLPIVALDDAVGLVVFAVSFGIAKAMISGALSIIVSVLVNPLIEIVLSLLLGMLAGAASRGSRPCSTPTATECP